MSLDMREVTSSVENMLDDHMEDQPYRVECYCCGKELTIAETSHDSDFDLTVVVEPCDCVKKEKKDA